MTCEGLTRLLVGPLLAVECTCCTRYRTHRAHESTVSMYFATRDSIDFQSHILRRTFMIYVGVIMTANLILNEAVLSSQCAEQA